MNLNATEEHCSWTNKKWGCSYSTLAPVFTTSEDEVYGLPPVAWAVGGNGTHIPQDRCEDTGGAGGLCGILIPKNENRLIRRRVEIFKDKYPEIKVSDAMPYIVFVDPASRVTLSNSLPMIV